MITVTVVNEEMALQAGWDRVIVLEDPYKSGRECLSCGGLGHEGEPCTECHGNKKYRGKVESDDECTTCTVGQGVFRRSLGFLPCNGCKGSGTSSIFIPDDAQTRPTTGVIQSLGPLCGYIRMHGDWVLVPVAARYKVGDRVIFHAHVGNKFELGSKNDVVIRFIKESELLGTVKGIVKKSPEHGEFKELKEVGIEG